MKFLFKFIQLIIGTLYLLFLVQNVSAVETLTINSPNYFDEQTNIFNDIHFLKDEHLSFNLCLDKNSKDITANIICDNNQTDLPLSNYDDNRCYYDNFDLKKLDCDNFKLEVEYNLNNKIKKISRTFAKQKESYLINHILEKNYTQIPILDTSYYLKVLNEIQSKDYKKNQEIYDYLKSKRDNTNKCWPTGNCDLTQTISILKNLKDSGYDLNSRMIEDGKIYVQNNIISDLKPVTTSVDSTKGFEIKINNNFTNQNIGCDLNIDNGGETRSYLFDNTSSPSDLLINKFADSNIKFTCDNNLDNINLKIFDQKVYSQIYDNQDSFSYNLPSSISDSDEITYYLRFKNNFSSTGSISCDVKVDGNINSYTFDSSSTDSNLLFENTFSDNIEVNCDDNLDNIYLDVYKNLNDEIDYNDKDNFEYNLDSLNSSLEYEFKYNFSYDFTGNEVLTCNLITDGKTPRIYTFDKNSNLEVVGKKASNSISLSCDKNLKEINFQLYDIFSRVQVQSQTENVNSNSYTIPSTFSKYSCIGKNNVCNFDDSLNALSIYGNTLNDASKIEEYIDSLIQENANQYYISTTNKYLDTGKYLSYKKNEKLVSFLKYSQNNDGSWGISSTDKLTDFWAILGLRNSDGDSEYLKDGEKWIYYNEPINGWGSIEKDTTAYFAIKEKLKPYIIINPINEISQVASFEIQNPTIFNIKDLKITFSDSIAKYLKVTENLGQLDALTNINFNISTIKGFAGSKVGDIFIEGLDGKNNKLDLLKLPITIKGPTPFKVTLKNYFISTNQNDVIVPLTKNQDVFSTKCELTNPFTNLKHSYNITQNNLEIKLSNPQGKVGNFTTDLTCDFQGSKFVKNLIINVKKTKETFSFTQNSISISSAEDFSVSIHSTDKNKQTLTLKIEGDLSNTVIPTENSKIIAANDSRDIYFSISKPQLLNIYNNTLNSKLIVTSSSGYSKSIPLYVNLNQGSNNSTKSHFWLYFSIIMIVLLIFTIMLIRRYRQLQYEEDENVEYQNQDEEMYFD